MDETEVIIKWTSGDVKLLNPDWSDNKCNWALDEIGERLEERSIELGWEVLEVLLNHNLDINQFNEEFYNE